MSRLNLLFSLSCSLLILILFPINTLAIQHSITSLPYTINTGGTSDTFTLASDLTLASGTCITMTQDNVTLDLGGHTIYFGADGTNNCIGIYCRSDNAKIIHGRIIHNVVTQSTSVTTIRGIDISANQYLLIRGIYIEVKGYVPGNSGSAGIHCIFDAGNTFMTMMSHDTLLHHGTGYWRRDLWPASCYRGDKAWNDALITDPTTQYHIAICSSYVEAIHNGLFGYGQEGYSTNGCDGVFWFFDNEIKMQARNDGPYDPAASGGYRLGETYAIASRGASVVRIWNNNIYADTLTSTSEGGLGIFVEITNTENFPGFWSEVYNNTIFSASGTFYGKDTSNFGHATCIRVRHGTHNLKVHDNILTSYSDSDSSTYHFNIDAVGIWSGYNAAGNLADSIFIYNNHITVHTLDNDVHAGTNVSTANGIRLAAKDSALTADGTPVFTDYWEVYNNYIKSNNYAYWLNGSGAITTMSVHGDTLYKSDDYLNTYDIRIGELSNTYNVYGIKFRDLTFLNGADDQQSSIYFGTRGLQNCYFERTLNVLVEYEDTTPTDSAIVTVTNNIEGREYVDTTDATGLSQFVVPYSFYDRTNPDTTNYNDYIIEVARGDSLKYDTFTVSATSASTVVILVGGEEDYDPPMPVKDLYIRGFKR